MTLQEYLKSNNASVYALSKASGIPYSTTLSICNGKANIEECRLSTLRALARALDISLMDLIDGEIASKSHNFINSSIIIDLSALPSELRSFIDELEEYDEEGDPAFYAAADTMLTMADRCLKSGSINSKTYAKLASKYPIGE